MCYGSHGVGYKCGISLVYLFVRSRSINFRHVLYYTCTEFVIKFNEIIMTEQKLWFVLNEFFLAIEIITKACI